LLRPADIVDGGVVVGALTVRLDRHFGQLIQEAAAAAGEGDQDLRRGGAGDGAVGAADELLQGGGAGRGDRLAHRPVLCLEERRQGEVADGARGGVQSIGVELEGPDAADEFIGGVAGRRRRHHRQGLGPFARALAVDDDVDDVGAERVGRQR
jgi:hypothetical protein